MDRLRTLMPGDLPSAIELSMAAGWNQTLHDWQRLLRLAPNGCRCIEVDGRVAATTTRLTYGNQLGWIGMVLTHPENRRQGHARRLMEDALCSADQEQVGTLMLDATDQGRPLYESLGFLVEHLIERWERKGATPPSEELPGHCHLDHDFLPKDVVAFGVDRRQLLLDLELSGRCKAIPEGYVLSREGRVARYLGPCVADSADAARQLIAHHLGSFSQSPPWYWDLDPGNVDTVQLATELGFTRSRVLWRMRRGQPIASERAKIFAIAGFELG